LIADPFLTGPVFERSVILLADHSSKGAMGFILNQPTHFKVKDAIPELKDCNQQMYYGGPVDESLLFYVHSLGNQLPNSVQISENLFWGGEFSVLQELIAKKVINSENIKFFIGYSGWEMNQLEREFKKKSWIIGDFEKKYIFAKQKRELWNETIDKSGHNNSFLGNFAHSPSLN
jgi:putative transcriptional regulator